MSNDSFLDEALCCSVYRDQFCSSCLPLSSLVLKCLLTSFIAYGACFCRDTPTFAFTNKHPRRLDNKQLTPSDVALSKLTDLLTEEQYQVFRVDFSILTDTAMRNEVCTLCLL